MIPLKDNIPTSRFPILTALLIVANVAIFIWQLSLPTDQASSPALARLGVSERDQKTIEYGAIPDRLTHPGTECGIAPGAGQGSDIVCGAALERPGVVELDAPPWWATVFSSMFLHANLLHIGFNMLFLWIFGNNVEDSMGRPRFLLFYLLAGIVAAYAQALLNVNGTEPAIGASGAIAGVLGGYALLFPAARVLTIFIIFFFVTFFEIPALLMLGVWFLLQFLPAVGQLATPDVAGSTGGVAYLAHVGGFIFGLAAIRLFANRYRKPDAGLPLVSG